jgi:hypothetical protein
MHWTSIEEMGDGNLLMSMRSAGVYKIDRATGEVIWKLGGNNELGGSPHLTVLNDDRGGPRYQHDARELADGTITIHDNHGVDGLRPRATRYTIDETAMTATLIEEHVNDDVDGGLSGFIGSARWQPDGHVVVAWGGTSPFIEEFDESGASVFRIRLNDQFQYRVVKYGIDELDRDLLRATAGRATRYDAPRDVTATPAPGAIDVSWELPSEGAPIAGYTAYATPANAAGFSGVAGPASCSTAGATGCTITGLQGGGEYVVTVIAHNSSVHGSIASLKTPVVTVPA